MSKLDKGFTVKVMQKINTVNTSYEPILSKISITVGGLLVVLLFIMIVITTKDVNFNIDFSIISELIVANLNLLVLPFSIVTLMFLKEWFYYSRVMKN